MQNHVNLTSYFHITISLEKVHQIETFELTYPIPNMLGPHPVEKVFFRYFSCALERSCTACHNALIGLNHSTRSTLCSEGKATNLLHLSYISAWTTQLVIIITSIPTVEKHNGLIRLTKSIDKKSLWHEKVAKMLRLQW